MACCSTEEESVASIRCRIFLGHYKNTTTVINEAGIEGTFTKREKNKAIAHLYQGIEVTILNALAQRYPNQIVLFIHDAVISTDRLDVAELSRMASEATGYTVKFEEEIIG